MQMLAKSVLTHNVNVSDQLDRCFELVFGLSDGSNALGQTPGDARMLCLTSPRAQIFLACCAAPHAAVDPRNPPTIRLPFITSSRAAKPLKWQQH